MRVELFKLVLVQVLAGEEAQQGVMVEVGFGT